MAKHTGNAQSPQGVPTVFFTKQVAPLEEVSFSRATVAAMERTAKALENLRGRMLAESPGLALYSCAPMMWNLDTPTGLLRESFYEVNRLPDLLRDYLARNGAAAGELTT